LIAAKLLHHAQTKSLFMAIRLHRLCFIFGNRVTSSGKTAVSES
jgi:hypothetical protein